MGSFIKLSAPDSKGFWEVPVLFEDEHLIALDKPSGLAVSRTWFNTEGPNLMQLLHEGIAAGKKWGVERGLSYLMNAQRLDEAASGLVLLAKSKPVLVALLDAIGSNAFTREYVALVRGEPPEDSFEVEAKLAPQRFHPGLVRVDQKAGKQSRTRFEVTERLAKYAMVRCVPFPERPHQVRAHLSHAGFPVVGDRPYRGRLLLLSSLKPDYHLKPNQEERPLLAKAGLHAEKLRFQHPVTKVEVEITAPLPKDLLVALKYLRRFAPPRT
jgi:RluA family pseudouridine synthase